MKMILTFFTLLMPTLLLLIFNFFLTKKTLKYKILCYPYNIINFKKKNL